MARRTRECYLCGTAYKYCSSCSQDKNKPSWMTEFHAENCKNIFQICTDFNLGIKTKHEAKAALEQCDLSNKENFKVYVQNDLENIFKEEPKFKRSKRSEFAVDEAANIETHEVVLQENE